MCLFILDLSLSLLLLNCFLECFQLGIGETEIRHLPLDNHRHGAGAAGQFSARTVPIGVFTEIDKGEYEDDHAHPEDEDDDPVDDVAEAAASSAAFWEDLG